VDSCGHILSHQAINVTASRDPNADGAHPLLKAPRRGDWLPGPVSDRGGRQNGLTGGKILHAHVYRNEEKRRCGLLPGLVLLRLVAPPLQLGVVGPYLIRGVWFPSRLLLEGTDHI
jgi:hypothetical protein